MKLRLHFLSLLLLTFLFENSIKAQDLTEIKGKRLYEHHSPATKKPNGSVGGDQSAYDFVKHTYISSFDPVTFGKYKNGEEANIDMVEHEGPTVGPHFGITSGVSSIWGGDIRGNGNTNWVTVSRNFDYSTATLSEMEIEYKFRPQSSSIEKITEGAVYIARIRYSDMYVAMKCYNVTNLGGGNDVYFDFDYKYGPKPVGLFEYEVDNNLSIYPNPTSNRLKISNQNSRAVEITIKTIQGQTIRTIAVESKSESIINTEDWLNGIYILHYNNNGKLSTLKFIKN